MQIKVGLQLPSQDKKAIRLSLTHKKTLTLSMRPGEVGVCAYRLFPCRPRSPVPLFRCVLPSVTVPQRRPRCQTPAGGAPPQSEYFQLQVASLA